MPCGDCTELRKTEIQTRICEIQTTIAACCGRFQIGEASSYCTT